MLRDAAHVVPVHVGKEAWTEDANNNDAELALRPNSFGCLDKTLSEFADASVDVDVVAFGTRPLTSGLRRLRWQLFVHVGGWAYLPIVAGGIAYLLDVDAWCSPHQVFGLMETSCAAILCILSWLAPLFIHRNFTKQWLIAIGLVQLVRGIFDFMIAAQEVAVLSGFAMPLRDCSTAFRVYKVCVHGSIFIWAVVFAYIMIIDERQFINFLLGTALWMAALALYSLIVEVHVLAELFVYISVGLICMVGFVISTVRKIRRIRSARKAIEADEQAYNVVWSEIKENEADALSSLALRAGESTRIMSQSRVQQPTKSLDLLFADACEINDGFQSLLRSLAEQTGGRHVPGSIKRTQRALEKLRRVYADDGSYLLDLVRGSIVYDTVRGMEDGFCKVTQEAALVRVKNRFHPDHNATSTGGYRDVSINMSIPVGSGMRSHICEIQIQHVKLFALKSTGGHKRYIEFRNCSGN